MEVQAGAFVQTEPPAFDLACAGVLESSVVAIH